MKTILFLTLWFVAIVSGDDGNIQRATCTPDNCVNNYVRGKMYEFQRWILDEEGDEPLYFPEETSQRITTLFSDTTISFSDGVLTGLYSRMPVASGSYSSYVLNGYQYVYILSRQVTLRGSYSVSGTVLGNPADSSGSYEIYCDIYNQGYIDYKVNSAGILNVTSNSVNANWNIDANINTIPFFENFMPSGDPIRPVLTKYFAKNILTALTTKLRSYTIKFKNFTSSMFQGMSLADLTTWETIPTPSPTPPTIPTTTLAPVFGCLPDGCIETYYRKEVNALRSYAEKKGISQIAVDRTFFARTLTTTFDLDLTYTDIVVHNFLNRDLSGSLNINHDLAVGTFQASWYTDVIVSGSFAANGTILGQQISHVGTWSGKIRHILYLNYRYTLTADYETLNVNTPTLSSWTMTPSDFSEDLFHPLHPLKQPFDALIQTQLGNEYRITWVRDLFPYLASFFNDILNIATFQQLITSQLPATTPSVPISTTPMPPTTTTLPPPFQCEPDGCLVDFVQLKFSRFSDWVESVNRDPLILPGSHRVQFAIWDIDLYLQDITVYSYLLTFYNSKTTITSDCLSGTLTMRTDSPTLEIYGNYNSTGSLEEYSLTGSGEWSMNISIRSTLTLNYRIDSNGFISEIRDTFSTSILSRSGVVFENFIDPSAPLAALLLSDIATRASTVVATQIRTFTSLITDFMEILLTENNFIDIITWHRYGNETTDPPVICDNQRHARSTIFLRNWYIPIFGHVPLTIQGSRLDILQNLECHFHDVATTVVTATVHNLSIATCEIPYLYQTGRIPVEIILRFPNGCEQSFQETIVSAKPDDIVTSLQADVSSDGRVNLVWNPSHLPESATSLKLQLSELEYDSTGEGTFSWVSKGVLISSLENRGSYSGISEDLSILSSLTSGFVLFLSPVDTDASPKTAIYSDVLYTNYGKTPEYFNQACESWRETNSGKVPQNLEPCPPLLTQAWADSRFEYEWELQDYETLQFYHPGAEASFRQLIPNEGGSGSQCVYKNGQLLVGPPGGGRAARASPNNRTGYISHHHWDVLPWYLCCGFSKSESSCRSYYDLRPSDDGTAYRPPPRPGNGEGDPHFTTFDGVSYTFNGVGEFFMIKAEEEGQMETQFEMQARMEQFVDASSGQSRNASAFTSFAFKEFNKESNKTLIQLQVSRAQSGDGVEVLMNQVLVEIPPGFNAQKGGKPFLVQTQDGGSLSLFLDEGRKITHAFVSFGSGFSFNISSILGQGALNIVSFASSRLIGQGYTGLLGSIDGIPDNDLTFPGTSNPLPINATLRDIHYEFGLLWRTTPAESIFTYEFGKGHASYQKHDFVPNFEVPNFQDFPEAQEICGESQQCLYDYVSTGSEDFAKATKKFQEEFEEMGEAIEEIVVMCTPLNGLEEGWFSVDNYIAESVARFYCNPGFAINGAESIVCDSNGEWEKEEPTCVTAQDFTCTGKPDGYYANSKDCSKFFGCLNGALTERTCPFPLLFDPTRLTCVPSNSAVCA